MPEPSRRVRAVRRTLAFSIGWTFAAALYLLLIDITREAELIVGAGAALLAAAGFELARGQGVVGESLRARWLLRLYRPLLRVPADIAAVSAVALLGLVRRDAAAGVFRVAPFHGGGAEPADRGRRALAQAAGSFAPNTMIIGIDEEHDVVLAHQLRRRAGRAAIDPLELG
jgi:hypothetical protein